MLRRLTPLPGSVVPRAARAGLEMHVLCRAGAHHGQRRRRRHLRGFSAAAAAAARPRKAAAMPLLPDLACIWVKIYFPCVDVFSDPHTCVLHRGASGLGPPKFVVSFHKRKKIAANDREWRPIFCFQSLIAAPSHAHPGHATLSAAQQCHRYPRRLEDFPWCRRAALEDSRAVLRARRVTPSPLRSHGDDPQQSGGDRSSRLRRRRDVHLSGGDSRRVRRSR